MELDRLFNLSKFEIPENYRLINLLKLNIKRFNSKAFINFKVKKILTESLNYIKVIYIIKIIINFKIIIFY